MAVSTTVSAAPLGRPFAPQLRQALLQLHDDHRQFTGFEAFSAQLPALMELGRLRQEAATCVALLGLLEPLSGAQIEPRDLQIQRDNLRESLLAGGCLSRHRAITRVLEHLGDDLTSLRQKRIYLPETSTGFVHWLQQHLPAHLELSDFLQDAEIVPADAGRHQNLCELTYADQCFDLVICNDVFEHVYDLPRALEEVWRVLRPGGRLLATFPMAFGQQENIIKAEFRGLNQPVLFRGEPEYHGDPIRPTRGSLVYVIPGWQILDQASTIGFSAVVMHLISSWKHGVIGADLPGVLVADFFALTMARLSDLAALRLALLQQPGDPRRWQVLIERIEAMGAGLFLSELDGLFEQPLPASPAGRDSLPRQVLQQGLEAHRAGDIEGLRRAQKRLLELEPEGAWPCALQGLLAELEGVSGYAAFARALALEPGDTWFRYWLSVAALRRRDWLDFSCHALLLAHSETLEHQVLVLAAAAHLIAAVLVTLAPDLCEVNDLRVFDLVHPDAIPHDQPQLVAAVLRCMDKERRKMMRILIDLFRRSANEASGTEMLPPVPMHALVDLLRWRIAGLPEPRFSADLHAALQRQLELLPLQRQQHGDLQTLLPRRPDLRFGDEHLRVWRDFRLVLMSAQ